MPPVEQTPQNPNSPPAATAPANPGNDPPAEAPAGPIPAAPPSRPDGLADHFWDEATGVRTPELVQSYNELAAEQARQAEIFKDFPQNPADAGKFYVLPENMLPEGVALPEGTAFKANEELLNQALPVLHKHRVAPEAFQDLARAFNAHEVERYRTAMNDFAEDGKKLGPNGAARRKAVDDGLKALAGDKASFIDATAISAQAVEFFEGLIARFTSQGGVTPNGGGRADDPPPQPVNPWGSWSPGETSQQKAS